MLAEILSSITTGLSSPSGPYMALRHGGWRELVSQSKTVTHLIFCLHHTDCQDQHAWWCRATWTLTQEAEAWDSEEKGLWKGSSFSSPGKQDGVQRRGSKMDRQAERDGLGPADQVSQNPAKLSAKPLPLSHHLATYSFHPFSDCAHCLACLSCFFSGFGDLVIPPVDDGVTSQGQSSGEAVFAQLRQRVLSQF